jgi:peptidoglycan/xylan/chitin deacetylase (PgdA/CDA1 family)
MLSRHRLTESIAGGLQLTGAVQAMCAIANRRHGGYILAFHSAPVDTMVGLIDSLRPDTVVSLDDIVARHRAGRSTAGLFAITVDDGFGPTVEDYCRVVSLRGWPITFYLPTLFLDNGTLPFLLLQRLQMALPPVSLTVRGRLLDLRTPQARQEHFDELTYRMYRRPDREFVPDLEALADAAVAGGVMNETDLRPLAPPISWERVAVLGRQAGVAFESHGVTHQAVVGMDRDDLRRELAHSQREITARTGRPVRHFCYPYGGPDSVGDAAPAIVAEYFDSAVTMSRGRLGGHSPYDLPRVPLYDRDRPSVARLKVATATVWK